jgi:hypothetical protein
MWLYDEYNEIYHNNQQDLRTIYDLYIYYLEEDKIVVRNSERNDEEGDKGLDSLLEKVLDMMNKYPFVWYYGEDVIFKVVKKESNWKNPERDVDIYKERKKGVKLDKLAFKFNLDVSSISENAKKVKGAVNYHKGVFFEKEFYSYLFNLKHNHTVFDEVDKLGGVGESDLIAVNYEENTLFVFSLKCLEIRKKPHYIVKSELVPELERAYKGKFTYSNVFLILVLFNSFDNTTTYHPIDIFNPADVVLR